MNKTIQQWIQEGIDNGWCSPTYCATHQGPPYTEQEIEEADQQEHPYDYLEDNCTYAVRLYES